MRPIQTLKYLLLPALVLGAVACSGDTSGGSGNGQVESAAVAEGDGHDHDHDHAHDGHEHDGHEHDGHDHDAHAEGDDHDHDGDGHPDHDHADHDHSHDHGELAQNTVGDLDLGEGARLVYEVGKEEHNFGKAMEGAVLNHTFEVEAGGKTELVIKQVKPTCGCTIAKVLVDEGGDWMPYGFGDPIAPGTKIQIGATLHTKNKRGHQKSRINIFSNDPRGTIQLGLEAEVEAFFTVQPKHLSFQSMTVGDVQEHIVKVNTSKGERIGLELVAKDLPKGMEAELRPVEPDGNGATNRWDLWVKVGPDVSEGSIGHTFTLRSDKQIMGAEALPDGSMPVYEVSVSSVGRVTGMISFQPAYIAMGLVRPGQVVSRTVRITSHDKDFDLGEPTIRIAGVSTPDWEYADRFSTLVRPVDGENAIDVEVRLDGMPEDLNGSFRGNVIVEVGHPTKPTVELPVTGVCRGGAAVRRGSRNPGSQPGATAKPGSGN